MPGRLEGTPEDAAVLAGKLVWLLVGETDASWVEASEATKAALDAQGIETTLEVVAGQGHVLSLSQDYLMDWIDAALGR
jgi:hypothetical protein